MLQDIRGRNSDAAESKSRVLGVTSLQVTMYNWDRYAGANETLNSIVFDLFIADLHLPLILKSCVGLVTCLI
jgi:hypothetical protein